MKKYTFIFIVGSYSLAAMQEIDQPTSPELIPPITLPAEIIEKIATQCVAFKKIKNENCNLPIINIPKSFFIHPTCITTTSPVSSNWQRPIEAPNTTSLRPFLSSVYVDTQQKNDQQIPYTEEVAIDGPNLNNFMLETRNIKSKTKDSSFYKMSLSGAIPPLHHLSEPIEPGYTIKCAALAHHHFIIHTASLHKNNTDHWLELFSCEKKKVDKIAAYRLKIEKKAQLKTATEFKRLSFLTEKTLLGLTTDHQLYVIAHHDETFTFYPQKIGPPVSVGPSAFTIHDFAVDPLHPYLVAFYTSARNLYVASLKYLLSKGNDKLSRKVIPFICVRKNINPLNPPINCLLFYDHTIMAKNHLPFRTVFSKNTTAYYDIYINEVFFPHPEEFKGWIENLESKK